MLNIFWYYKKEKGTNGPCATAAFKAGSIDQDMVTSMNPSCSVRSAGS